jgi:hypothetical protein
MAVALLLAVSAVPAKAKSPFSVPVVNEEIEAMCGADHYVGTMNGTYTPHGPGPEKSPSNVNLTTIHIVVEFVSSADPTDSFTFISTGVAQVHEDETGDLIASVSGHTEARPGDGALAHGRWVLNHTDDTWINRGHPIGCTIIPTIPT